MGSYILNFKCTECNNTNPLTKGSLFTVDGYELVCPACAKRVDNNEWVFCAKHGYNKQFFHEVEDDCRYTSDHEAARLLTN